MELNQNCVGPRWYSGKETVVPCTATQCLMWHWGSAAAQLLPTTRISALSPAAPRGWRWWEGARDSCLCSSGKYSPENAVVGMDSPGSAMLSCTKVTGGKINPCQAKRVQKTSSTKPRWIFGSISPQGPPASPPVSAWNRISSRPGGQQCTSLCCERYLKPPLHLLVCRGFLIALWEKLHVIFQHSVSWSVQTADVVDFWVQTLIHPVYLESSWSSYSF